MREDRSAAEGGWATSPVLESRVVVRRLLRHHNRRGHVDEAMDLYRRAAEIDERQPEAHYRGAEMRRGAIGGRSAASRAAAPPTTGEAAARAER
ncbi:MAG: tetratricopeptide repeat protein [Polyangiaceae bacterium]